MMNEALEYWFDMACTEEIVAARLEYFARRANNLVVREVVLREAKVSREAAEDSLGIALGYARC